MADFQQDFMQALNGGVQFGAGLRQRLDQNKVNSLASQAYGATDPAQRQQLVQDAIGVNAGQGFQVEGQLDQTEDRRTKTMVNMAKLLTSAPEQARPGLYARMVPTLGQLGLQDLPPVYDPQTAPTIMSAADSIVKALGSGQDNQRNAIVAPGSAVVDPQTGQVIYERAYTPKNQTIEVAGPDGRPRQYTFDALNNRYIPATLGDQATAAPQTNQAGMPMVPAMDIAAIQADYQDVANRHGLRITSMERSASENAGIPGAANNSQHVGKTAVDYSTQGLSQEKIRQVEQEMRAKGYEGGYTARGTAPHMHFELPPNRANSLRNTGAVVAGPSPFVGRTPEEEAAAVARAKGSTELDLLPAELALRSNSAINQAVGIEAGKNAAEKAAAAPATIATLQNSITSIDELLADQDLGDIVGIGSLNPLNRVPGTAARGKIARAEQIAGQSFLAAFNQLKGGGAITEREGAAATAAMARLDRSQSEADYRKALTDLRAAITPAIDRARQQQSAGAPRPAGRTIQRTGTLNGRKVVQYSDGTTEYAD